jgi:hypothetical protein
MRSGRYDLRSNLKRDEKTDFVMTYSKKHRIKEDIVCNEGEIAESLVSGLLVLPLFCMSLISLAEHSRLCCM